MNDIYFILLMIVASVAFTAMCFTFCIALCWYGRYLSAKHTNRQIREIKSMVGVNFSGIGGSVTTGSVAGRDLSNSVESGQVR
jgi:threonine/homoserine/homoserine lactone efflux protein